ncbi:hypothetical protein BDV96DRAFT_593937 [Lophiotrema nucula]|uniref:BTB domain-containing protein n=1 Tax=Lophiotrema nucula TaxID=690887 RepID=A0A6A5ZSM6_9PLEO|nr:hypothetical protein BDV96DRAFT_593937 [Lophiotrema nucula]
MANTDDARLKPMPKAPFIAKSLALPIGLGIVKVLVGSEAQEILLHEAVLTSRSLFFKKALQGRWAEAETKTVKLSEDDPETFALYAQVAYTNAIPAFDVAARPKFEKLANRSADECLSASICQKEYEQLSKLYVLAEKIQDQRARNTTAEALLAKVTEECKWIMQDERWSGNYPACLPGSEAIRIMYEGTGRLCPGRAVIIEAYVEHGSRYSIGNLERDIVPKDFAYDVADFALSYRRMSPYSSFNDFNRYEECEGQDWEIEWFDVAIWPGTYLHKNGASRVVDSD